MIVCYCDDCRQVKGLPGSVARYTGTCDYCHRGGIVYATPITVVRQFLKEGA